MSVCGENKDPYRPKNNQTYWVIFTRKVDTDVVSAVDITNKHIQENLIRNLNFLWKLRTQKYKKVFVYRKKYGK